MTAKLIWLTVISVLLSGAAQSHAADPLKEILDSPVLDSLSERIDADYIDTIKYHKRLPASSPYARLFVEHKGHELILPWLESHKPRWPVASENSINQPGHSVRAQARYSLDQEQYADLLVLIPNPNIKELIPYNLDHEFAALNAKPRTAGRREQFTLGGQRARFAEEVDNRCAIVVELPQNGRARLEANCSHQKELREIAASLNIERLARNLKM